MFLHVILLVYFLLLILLIFTIYCHFLSLWGCCESSYLMSASTSTSTTVMVNEKDIYVHTPALQQAMQQMYFLKHNITAWHITLQPTI